jgi:hypothetical protein
MSNHNKFFSPESEAERRELYAKVRIGKLDPSEYSRLTWSEGYALPLYLPDGIRGLIYPDQHAPAQNRRILHAIYNFQSWFRPHVNFNVGDYSDMFALSRWPKAPRTPVNAQYEVEESALCLRKSMKFGAPFWTFVDEGNHDGDRMTRYLTNVCPTFSHYLDPKTRNPMTAMVNMMGFTKDDPITFLSGLDDRGGYEGGVLINGEYKIEHGDLVKPTPGDSVRATAEAMMQSTGMGHVHRAGRFARDVDGKVLRGDEFGCLIDMDHPYFNYHHGRHNWFHAFGVYHVVGGMMHVQIIPIFEALDENGQLQYWFQYAGRVFRSSDR